MIYAHRILSELDHHLDGRIELTLCGRAAFLLGFPNPLPVFSQSLGVDVVLWLGQAEQLETQSNFWEALEKTNDELETEGFYMSHLFEDDQVILTKNWRQHREPIIGEWKNLNLSRLSDEDLFLSKLNRDDPQDRDDAQFIVARRNWSVKKIRAILARAVVPELQELQDEFEKATASLLRLVETHRK